MVLVAVIAAFVVAEIVCDPGEIAGVAIVNDRLTGVAGAKVALPSWVAVSEQVPAATAVITKPETVQILVSLDVNVTTKPDEAVGVTL